MKFKLTTYKTFKGPENIVELIKKKNSQAVIYQNNKPVFFVDCFDLQTESNVLMNSLVLCNKRHMRDVIKEISIKNNINLSIKKAPRFSIESKSEIIELNLPPLPEEWLN